MKRLHGSYGAATPSVQAGKIDLRRVMRRLRRTLALTHPEAAEDAASHRIPVSGQVVAAYHPIGSELDPAPLLARLLAEGWAIALPRADSQDALLTFHPVGGDLAPDAFDILAPLASTRSLTPDLVIAPVLAFDRAGGRLGQGAGCYDRTIAALREAGPVSVIGLAYAGQEVACVPTDRHDQRLDGILTDKGLVEVVDASA